MSKKLTIELINTYLIAYDDFYNARINIGIDGNPKVDSQISEFIASEKLGFIINHSKHLDGIKDGKTYEVKGTGYVNNQAKFSEHRADFVIWVKFISRGKYEVRQMKNANLIYASLDKDGFVDLSKFEYILV